MSNHDVASIQTHAFLPNAFPVLRAQWRTGEYVMCYTNSLHSHGSVHDTDCVAWCVRVSMCVLVEPQAVADEAKRVTFHTSEIAHLTLSSNNTRN